MLNRCSLLSTFPDQRDSAVLSRSRPIAGWPPEKPAPFVVNSGRWRAAQAHPPAALQPFRFVRVSLRTTASDPDADSQSDPCLLVAKLHASAGL